jgi:hypothetical protein
MRRYCANDGRSAGRIFITGVVAADWSALLLIRWPRGLR